MDEMLLGPFSVPTGILNQSFDERLAFGMEIDHAAVIVADQRDAPDLTNGDGMRHFEFAVAQIGAARANDISKVIRDVQVLAMIHAHTD